MLLGRFNPVLDELAGRVELIARNSESVQSEGGVRVRAGPALDESLTSDDARRSHPEPLHDRPRGTVVHLCERRDRQVRLVLYGPQASAARPSSVA